jgi:8-amino-7-oxononanoate synthase
MSLASFESKLERKLQKRKEEGLLRFLECQETMEGILDFSSNDYFALANNREIASCYNDYFAERGLGSGASRLVSGNHCSYIKLEENLAKYKKTEAALVFGSGYLAAFGVIPNLCGKGDLVIADKNIHKSALDAIKLSGAKLLRYEHNNNESCAKVLKDVRQNYQNCLLVTETLFSMDGDYADVKGLYNLAEEYDALLLLDDAHGLGIFEDYPKGFSQRLMIMGTMSKALGSYGGYIACSKLLKSYLVNHASSLT